MTQTQTKSLQKSGIWKKIKEKQQIMFCLLSVAAVQRDIRLAMLPVVFLLLCREKQSRVVCAAAVILSCGVQSVTSSFYIPYMAFVFIYLLADFMLEGKRNTAVCIALVVFCAVKLYVLSVGYTAEYYAVFALEVASVLLLPHTVRSGAVILKENGMVTSSLQLVECASALAVAATACTGLQIRNTDAPLCFMLAVGFYFSQKDNMPLSMLCTVGAVFTQWNRDNFHLLFVGFMVVGLGAYAFLRKGNSGYFATIAVACGVALAFLAQFNSFVFVTNSSVALAGCFALGKIHTPYPTIATEDKTANSDYIALAAGVDRLGRAFRFLGNTVADISNLMYHNTPPKEICQTVAEEICRRCKSNHICWQENYSHTQTQFSLCQRSAEKGEQFAFDSQFLSRCGKSQQVFDCFVAAQRLAATQQMINKAGRHNQQLLQNQFLAMATSLQDMVHNSVNKGVVNTAFTHTIVTLMASMGKSVNYCACYQNSHQCVLGTRDYLPASVQDRIRTKLESIYNTRFAQPVAENDSQGIRYVFSQIPQYSISFGSKSKSRYNICGDLCQQFLAEEYSYVILTDGMGTGSFAAAESRTAVAMLKSLLRAGISVENSVDIANIALNLKGTGQSCVALDILQINCTDGRAVLYKAGAAPTYLVLAGQIKKIYADSLPVGILKDTKLTKTEFVLNNGDSVVMLSDGVDADKALLSRLCLMAQKSTPQQMADYIINAVESMDDATAAVIRPLRA